MHKLTKAQAVQRGGQATVAKYGRDHMNKPLGTSDFAIVNRETGIPTGRTMNGTILANAQIERAERGRNAK